MPKPLPNLDALYAFAAAARLQSFKQAAQELHVSATAISHSVRKLEAALGCALFVRQVRAVHLTAEGQRLYRAVEDAMYTLQTALTEIRTPLRQMVRLSVTPEFAALWLLPRLASFQAQYPDTDLHVHAGYQAVDLPGGAADLAVRYGLGNYRGVVSEVLFQEYFAPLAAPALRETLPADAQRWPLIHMDWHDTRLAHDWASWAKASGLDAAAMQGGLRYSDGSHAVQAAIAGQGVALLGTALLQELLQQGLLMPVAETRLAGAYFHVCHAQGRELSAAAQQVKEWLLGDIAGTRKNHTAVNLINVLIQ